RTTSFIQCPPLKGSTTSPYLLSVTLNPDPVVPAKETNYFGPVCKDSGCPIKAKSPFSKRGYSVVVVEPPQTVLGCANALVGDAPNEENWTADKTREHNTYTSTLGNITANYLDENQSKAISALKTFTDEANGKPVCRFWDAIIQEKHKAELLHNTAREAGKQSLMVQHEITEKKRAYLSDEDGCSSSDSEIVPVSLINVFLNERSYSDPDELDKTTKSSTDALKAYQIRVLPDDKLIYNYMDVLDYKGDETGKSPISIRMINFYNTDCTKYLPPDYKMFIANQLQDKEIRAVNFTRGRTIDKFLVNCEEDVMQFLDKFEHIKDLESLGRCLGENLINYSTASNDLIYVQNLLKTFYFLYKNDILLQAMSEREYNSHIWTPLLRNAFLRKTDIKFNYGELASISYNKLKEILNIARKSGPKLDGKAFLRSLGTEVLAQEDGILNTRGKRKGDLRKLEYCTKVILTALFQLTISASKYLFEDTIITMDLQDIEILKTVEAFSKLIAAIKVILSWKARTRKNTDEIIKDGH
ncbi:3247_t:CDS:2, partial [Funneliformis geosporum]